MNPGNSSGILETIWKNQGISRIDLAKRLGIDKSTVGHVVADLIERTLVEEYDQAEASSLGGRRPVRLRLRADFGYAVGVEVQPDFYRLVVVNVCGEKVFTLTGSEVTDAARFSDRFHDILDELRRREPKLLERCLGAGLAVSGIVDPFQGTVLESTNLGMRNVRVLPELGADLAFPLLLENDANAACWGEVVRQQSLHHDLRSFLFCLLEFHQHPGSATGGSVGLGFVVNGRIHYGENFSAGEFRSLGWKPGHAFQLSLDDGEMARLKTETALRQRFFGELADHLLFVGRVFNLNHLYFGGEVDPFRDELSAAFDEARLRAWPRGDCPCVVQFSTHGADAVAFGAASLGLTNFFRDPGNSVRLAASRVFR